MKRVLFSCLFLLYVTITFGQEKEYHKLPVTNYKNPQEYIIKDVEISGVEYLDESILVTISGFRQNQRIVIPGDDISEAIQKFWKQGLFSDVKITYRESGIDSVVINIYLKERPRLSSFEIFGLRKGQKEDLMEDLELKRGKQITENIINNSKNIILDYLYDKKYLNAKVDMVQKDDTSSVLNNVILQAYIDKGNKVKIKEIEFTGNEEYKDRKLRRKMKKTHRRDINIFKASKFIEEEYENDKQNILKEYRSDGFRDAEIISDSIYTVNEKRIGIHITLYEGKQYFHGDIDWLGNTVYSEERLTEVLGINRGDVYNTELLQERLTIDQDAVTSLFVDNGYLLFNVTPIITDIRNDTVDIQMRMSEGEQMRFDRIIIRGNTQTHEHVVRRELLTKPGDLFSRADIIQTQQRLNSLGHFDPEQFGIEPININPGEGLVDLEYSLVERHNDQFEISGGWGANMFVGTLGLRFSNFALKDILDLSAWKPVPTGDGQTLSLRATSNGSYYQSYSLSFVEPWLGGKRPNSFSFSVYHSVYNNASYLYQSSEEYMKTTGVSLGLGRRLRWPDNYFQLSHSISYQQYNLKDWTRYFFISDGVSNNLSLGTTFARNSVDNPLYPRRGSTFSLSLQITFPYSLVKEDEWWLLTEQEQYRDELAVINENVYVWAGLEEEQRQDLINERYEQSMNQKKYNWIEYHKWKYKGTIYQSLWKDLVLAFNSEFGYLGYYYDELGPSPFGGFELGGDGMSGYSLYGVETVSLRGYDNRSLTPAKGGNVYEKINIELRYPITLKPQAQIYVLGFIEAGNAWYDINSFNPFELKRSAGVGLRAFLPMFGLLGIDWGYGFDPVPSGNTDANGSQFHFIIGQQF